MHLAAPQTLTQQNANRLTTLCRIVQTSHIAIIERLLSNLSVPDCRHVSATHCHAGPLVHEPLLLSSDQCASTSSFRAAPFLAPAAASNFVLR